MTKTDDVRWALVTPDQPTLLFDDLIYTDIRLAEFVHDMVYPDMILIQITVDDFKVIR